MASTGVKIKEKASLPSTPVEKKPRQTIKSFFSPRISVPQPKSEPNDGQSEPSKEPSHITLHPEQAKVLKMVVDEEKSLYFTGAAGTISHTSIWNSVKSFYVSLIQGPGSHSYLGPSSTPYEGNTPRTKMPLQSQRVLGWLLLIFQVRPCELCTMGIQSTLILRYDYSFVGCRFSKLSRPRLRDQVYTDMQTSLATLEESQSFDHRRGYVSQSLRHELSSILCSFHG